MEASGAMVAVGGCWVVTAVVVEPQPASTMRAVADTVIARIRPAGRASVSFIFFPLPSLVFPGRRCGPRPRRGSLACLRGSELGPGRPYSGALRPVAPHGRGGLRSG